MTGQSGARGQASEDEVIPLNELEVARLESLHTARENLLLRRQLLDASEYRISVEICQRAGLGPSMLSIDLNQRVAVLVRQEPVSSDPVASDDGR